MSGFTYRQIDSTRYEVGFYSPDGRWHVEGNYRFSSDAAERCVELNGGETRDQRERRSKEEETARKISDLNRSRAAAALPPWECSCRQLWPCPCFKAAENETREAHRLAAQQRRAQRKARRQSFYRGVGEVFSSPPNDSQNVDDVEPDNAPGVRQSQYAAADVAELDRRLHHERIEYQREIQRLNEQVAAERARQPRTEVLRTGGASRWDRFIEHYESPGQKLKFEI